MTILLPVVAVLGLVIGSFLNVVIHRVPRDESLVAPGSHCPACQHPIRPWHNIPVLGWLMLRGRCADCGAAISRRYPLVELGTGLLFVAVTLRVVQLGLVSALPAYLYLTAMGIALAAIDLEWRRLPNAIVLPSYWVLAVLVTASAAAHQDWWSLVRAEIGGVVLFGAFFAMGLVHPKAMGFGDIKLAGILGGMLAYLSWSALIIGAFAGFVLGALAGIGLMVSGRGTRKTMLPFGPFMVAGALLSLFAAEPIAALYLSTLQL